MRGPINERVAYYRKLANLSQTDTAEALNMKYSTYSQMERKGTISGDMIMRLAEVFGVRPEYLLYDPETKYPGAVTEGNALLTARQHIAAPSDDQMILTHKEQNIIKIYRNMVKAGKTEMEIAVTNIYQKYKR